MVAFKFGLFGRFDIKPTIGQKNANDEPTPSASTTSARGSLHEKSTTPSEEDKARPKASKCLIRGKCRIVPLPYAPVATRERIEADASTVPQGPEKCRVVPDKKEQLRSYLLEIVAFTFGTDFDTLNDALGQERAGATNSILSSDSKKTLVQLGRQVQRLGARTQRDEYNTLTSEEKQSLYRTLCDPARQFNAPGVGFALDLVASYADHQCDPARWGNTVAAYWQKDRDGYLRNHKRTLSVHVHFISVIAPNEAVQNLLGAALEEYQRGQELTDVRYQRHHFPVRNGFGELYDMLLDHASRRSKRSKGK